MMNCTETVALLRQLTEWRQGADIDPPAPRKIDEAINAAIELIESMRNWIHEEGTRNNICTYSILGEICGYCECKRKKESK